MDLSLTVTFAALDRLTGPLKRIGQTSGRTAQAVSKTTKELAALNREQAKIAKLKVAQLDLDKNNADIDAARRRVRALRDEIARTERPTVRLTNALASAERQEARLVATKDNHVAKLRTLERELGAVGVNVRNLAGEELRLARAIGDTNRRLADQGRRLEAVNRHRARMDGAREIGGRLQSAGAQSTIAGAAIGAPLVASADKWAEFQSSMTDLAQKAGQTRRQIKGIGDEIQRIGPEVGQLPTDLVKGLDTLVGLGMDLRQGAAALRPIGQTATAYKAEIEDLSNTVYAATSNLKLFAGAERDAAEQQRRTAQALDIMATAGKRGGFELRDMAKAFPSLTARAQALGQSGATAVADLSAALQIARRGAGNADEAATNIANVLAKINTKDTIKNFKEMGVDLPEALKAAYAQGKTPLEAIAELTDKALGGNLDRLPFLFGDMQAQMGVTALIQNLEDYRKIRADAAAAGDVVGADFAARMDDSAAKTARFNAQMENLRNRVGGVVGPQLDLLKLKVANLANRFLDWADRNPETFRTLILIAGAIAALLVVVGTLSIVIGAVAPGFMILVRALGFLMPALRVGSILLKILGNGLLWLGRLALANPFLALAFAIGVAAYLIYTHWDKIKAAFGVAMKWLGEKWAQFKAFGSNLVQGLIDGITGRLAALKSTVLGIANSAKGWFKAALGIKSPSRIFRQFGGFITQGLAIGVDRGAARPLDRMRRLAAGMTAAGAAIAAPSIALGNAPLAPPVARLQQAANVLPRATQVDRLQQASAAVLSRTAPVPRLAGAGATAATPAAPARPTGEVHNHYHIDGIKIELAQSGTGDVRALARQIMEAIEAETRNRATRSYDDD